MHREGLKGYTEEHMLIFLLTTLYGFIFFRLSFDISLSIELFLFCFLSLVVGAGNWYLHFYHGNATFNIKLILRIIRYPHNNMCFLKVSYDSVN